MYIKELLSDNEGGLERQEMGSGEDLRLGGGLSVMVRVSD
jgi:hypothetical protein